VTPHIEKETCLKESEWKEVHEFVAGTKVYRQSLCDKLDGIKEGLLFNRNVVFGLIVALIVPVFMGAMSIGEMRRQIDINTIRLDKLEAVAHGKLSV
jgi:hypothetical protein